MLTTAVAAALALGAADPVHAQTNNACGPADASGHVVCTPAGNPYSDGIVYQAPVQDLTVALEDGVAVERAPGVGSGIRLRAPTGSVSLDASANSSVTTSGADQAGVIVSAQSDIAIRAPNVAASGYESRGVVAVSSAGNVAITTRSVTTTGEFAPGIVGAVYGDNRLVINAEQNVSATGAYSIGVYGYAEAGPITISTRDVQSGATAINAIGKGPISITADGDLDAGASGVVFNGGDGPVTVTVNGAIRGGRGVSGAAVGDVAVTVTGPIAAEAGIGGYGVSVQSDGRATVRTGSISSVTNVFVGAAVSARAAVVDIGVQGDVAASGPVVSGIRTLSEKATINISGDLIATDGARGLLVQSRGDAKLEATISIGGALAAEGDGMLISDSGIVDIAVGGGITVVDGSGIALSGGELTAVADISTSGGPAILDVNTRYSHQKVVSRGNLTTEGEDAPGIRFSRIDAVDINSTGTIATSGTYSDGIRVETVDGFKIKAGTINVTGDLAYGVFATDAGAAGDPQDLTNVSSIAVDRVTTSGTAGFGIFARNANRLDIAAGSIVTSGQGATGLYVKPGEARYRNGYYSAVVAPQIVNANIGSISTSGAGADAISIQATRGINIVSNGSIATTGAGADGIVAASGGQLAIASSGTISVSGAGSKAIDAQAGLVSVDVNNLSVAGADSRGIVARAALDAAVTVRGSATGTSSVTPLPVTPLPANRFSDTAVGLVDVAAERSASVTNLGTIATSGANEGGITIRSAGTAIISGAGSVRTTGNGATGAYAGSTGVAASVTQGSITTTGSNSTAVLVRSFGDASATLGSVSTSGSNSRGISVVGGRSATVTAGDVTTRGSTAVAVEAQSYGPVSVTVGNVVASGPASTALFAYASSGATTVKGGNVTVSDYNGAVVVAKSGSASAALGDVTKTGNGGFGAVIVRASDAASLTFGNVMSSTTGRSPDGTTGGAILVTGGGNVSVSGNSVRVSGGDVAGIGALSYAGNAAVTVTGPVSTSGPNSSGIIALASNGAAAVRTGAVAASGDQSAGVVLAARSASLVATGPISTTGSAGTGRFGPGAVQVTASAGDANVSLGSVSSTGAGIDAVTVSASGAASLSFASGSIVTGNRDSVNVTSGAGASLVNGGTITGGSGAAVRIVGGAATITNNAVINGMVITAAGADTLTNAGTLTLANGSTFGAENDSVINAGTLLLGGIDFGTGTDSLVNSGVVRLTAGSGAQSRTLTGLEALSSSGLIDLRSGIAGDTLTAPGSFAGTGGSTLAVDVNFAGGSADRLIVGGAATGTTSLIVNPIGAGNAVLVSGITVVQAGSGSSAGAFVLAPQSRSAGFIEYGLVANAGATSFALVGAPAPAAYRAGKIGEGAQTMARTALDAVSAHLIDTREEANSGFWFQAHGDVVRREEGGSFTNFGFTRNVDLGYRQDGFGGQIGFDKSFGGARLGLTGGYESSVMNFRGAGDRVTLDAWSGGLYAAFAAGPLFVNAQGLYTRYSVEARLRSAGAEDRFNGHSWSGKLQAGLRLGGSGFFAEPVVGLSYVDTSLGSLSALGARIDFTDSEGLFGEAGLRLGSAMNLAGGARLTLYASGSAVKSFEGTNRARFVTGATAIELGSDRLPTHGLGKLGVSIGQGRFTGFLEGRAVVADDYRGGGARMGLRIAF